MKTGFLAALGALSIAVCAAASGAAANDAAATGGGKVTPPTIRILTASPGGTYFEYGSHLAELIERKLGKRAEALVSGGPYLNMLLVDVGEAEIGLVTLSPARECWTGTCPTAPGVEMRNMRAVFPMYETPFHVLVKADSGVRRLEDVAGGAIGVGPYEGTAGVFFVRFLRTLGIAARPEFGTLDQQADALAKGTIRAFGLAAGVPVPAGLRIAQAHRLSVVAFSPAQMTALSAKFPTLDRFTIRAGTYPGQETAVETLSMWNFIVAHKAVPEAFVRGLVDALIEDGAGTRLHAAAAQVRPEDVRHNQFIWLHPGALNAFRARGIAVPAAVIPPEAETATPAGDPAGGGKR